LSEDDDSLALSDMEDDDEFDDEEDEDP